jgi:selenocysteine lyase/cysteine desulfurase
MEVNLTKWRADFVAMPGHKGLLGPQGTGLLLCGRQPLPLLYGGTGGQSQLKSMPEDLPERLEAGTVNVPGAAGLAAGLRLVKREGVDRIGMREQQAAAVAAAGLRKLGLRVFSGPHQAGTVSFVARGDCEELAQKLGEKGIAVRAGLHCAPLAHESAGTLDTGTVRVSFGHRATVDQAKIFLQEMAALF